MREILFRGKRIDNGEWVYGDLYHGLNNMIYINTVVQIDDKTKCNKQFLVQYKTVSQYTGLKDKNGVKIFEGDYIGWFGNKNKDDFFKYAEDVLLKKVNKYGEFSLSTAEVYNNGNLEVIGNIHDK